MKSAKMKSFIGKTLFANNKKFDFSSKTDSHYPSQSDYERFYRLFPNIRPNNSDGNTQKVRFYPNLSGK